MSVRNYRFNHPRQDHEAQTFRDYASHVAKNYAEDKAYKNNNEDLIKNLVKNLMEGFYDAGMFRNCCNCDNWNDKAEVCRINNNMRPPAKVIVVGCRAHSAIIPF